MATRQAGIVEELVRKILVPLCAVSGLIVISGFFFPSFVGSVITGRGWLVVALLFFGSGLCYLALIRGEEPEPTSRDRYRTRMPYRRRIRQFFHPDTVRTFLGRQDPITFGVPVVVLVLFFAAFAALPAGIRGVVDAIRSFFLQDLGMIFLGAVFLFVLFCLFLVVGPWGNVTLGGPDAEPTYTYPTYFTMFFTAGIAAGIVFWGPAEGLTHYGTIGGATTYDTIPPFLDAPGGSSAPLVNSLKYTMFHWGFSAWTPYVVIGLPIAYFMYERDAPLRVSTLLTPFLGVDNLDSAGARLVDVLAVFATIGGLATSVALVSTQFLTAIQFQWSVDYGSIEPIVFVAGLTIIYVIAAATGVRRGIRRIAVVTIVLFVLFMGIMLGIGPREAVVTSGAVAFGQYLGDFVPMSLYMGGEWVSDWTVWNWSWWFSWAPFAGLFLAAISKGRRIRTVVLTGVLATTLATLAWFVVVGGTALHLQYGGAADILAQMSAFEGSESAVAGFPMFEALPLSRLLNFLFLALIVVFIVTSVSVSTLVIAALATRKELAPTNGDLVFWGVFQGAVAIAVLLVGGGNTLQAAAVLTGGPFAIISLVAVAGFGKALLDHRQGKRTLGDVARDAVEAIRSR